MAEHNELGKLGEELAVEFLRKEGYEILETNWTFQKAEIDIIAQKENTLAVVEVFGICVYFINRKVESFCAINSLQVNTFVEISPFIT